MNSQWQYAPFSDVFQWCQKSNIGSREGKTKGKYKLYIASGTEIKFYDEYLVNGESLVFGTGGNACIHYVTGPFAYTNHCEAAQRISNDICTKFYYYYFQKDRFAQLSSTFIGGGIKNSSKKKIGSLTVPILPFTEQNQIVARIEELFSQLDSGVETLKKTKQQLTVYRQAVLKEAFSSDYATKRVEISEIVDDIRIGPFGTLLHKSDYIVGGIPVVNPQHIKNKSIMPSATVTISAEKADELSAYKLRKNDIIMGRRGEMGRAAPITNNENGWICGTGSILFRLKTDFDAVFYSKILSSPDVVRFLEEQATGTTMKNLNEKIVQHIPVPYITVEMQEHITADMDSKMSVCDKIEQTIDAALQQAEAMRQSILKQAFEGRWV